MSGIAHGNFRPGSLRRAVGLRIRRTRWWVARWHMRIKSRFPEGSAVIRVANALSLAFGADGRLDPTDTWLAEKTGRTTKTVGRARKALAAAGFLTWQRRTTVTDGIEHQTSNAYQLQLPPDLAPDDLDGHPDSVLPPPDSVGSIPVQPDPAAAKPLSTAPVPSMSVNTQESLSLRETLSDIRPPTAAEIIRSMPARTLRAARTGLELARERMEIRLREATERRWAAMQRKTSPKGA